MQNLSGISADIWKKQTLYNNSRKEPGTDLEELQKSDASKGLKRIDNARESNFL